jgi:V/A-type H+/Na+-transporting ATPase subunit C
MSGGVSSYAAINARVRVMYSNLLGAEELSRLGDAADLASLVGLLKHTVYGPYFENLRDRDFTSRAIIFQIKRGLADAYQGVIHIAPAHTRSLLVQLYRHFEVNNLKAVLRGIVTGAGRDAQATLWDRVRDVLFPFGATTVLPAEAMVQAGNVAAAVELLRGTPYYDTLAFAMKRYSAERSLFPLEVALDLNYWRQLWTDARQLLGQDAGPAQRVVGALVDMNNLMWAIRYRVYQHLSEEELINYTLPFGFRVRDEDIRAIAAGADIAAVVQRLYPDLPDVNALLNEPKAGLPQLELRLQRHVIRECMASFVGNPFQIGVPLAYLVLRDLEIQDLTVLIEAKSSQLPAEKFQPYLLKLRPLSG